MDREKCVRPIIFAGKKLPQLELGEFVREPLMFLGHFPFRFRAAVGIAFFLGQLLQRIEILYFALQFDKRIDQ